MPSKKPYPEMNFTIPTFVEDVLPYLGQTPPGNVHSRHVVSPYGKEMFRIAFTAPSSEGVSRIM
jgi:hypothetical protein